MAKEGRSKSLTTGQASSMDRMPVAEVDLSIVALRLYDPN